MLLRVHASTVNPADWYRATGPYFMRVMTGGLRTPKNAAVGSDVAGRVDAVGKDVTPTVSFEEAAATPIAAVTALQGLRDRGRSEPGKKC